MSTKTGKQLGLKTLLLAQGFCCSCLCFMQKKTNQIGLLVTGPVDSSGMRTFRTLFDLASDWLMGKWSVLIGREKRSRD